MRLSALLTFMLAAFRPLFATEDESAAKTPETPAAPTVAPDTAAAPTDAAPTGELPSDEAPADGKAPAPVQTQPEVAQPGSAGDPVLETVKTPAHNVADEIHAELKKLEQLPAEVAAWFESKFSELKSHIKALL